MQRAMDVTSEEIDSALWPPQALTGCIIEQYRPISVRQAGQIQISVVATIMYFQ